MEVSDGGRKEHKFMASRGFCSAIRYEKRVSEALGIELGQANIELKRDISYYIFTYFHSY